MFVKKKVHRLRPDSNVFSINDVTRFQTVQDKVIRKW